MTTLPALNGSDKDNHLADMDRARMLNRLADQITAKAGNAPTHVVAELVALYREVALRQTDPRWWINNVTYALGPIVQKLFTDADNARLAQLAARR